jgi:uncharacterized protein YxeA
MKKISASLIALAAIAVIGTASTLFSLSKLLDEDNDYLKEDENEE